MVTRSKNFGREDDEGNCEYKYSLAGASTDRVRHLVTQLLFRLNEGGGRALYRVGVRDDGTAEGLAECELRSSLLTLRAMAWTLGARVAEFQLAEVDSKMMVAEVRVEAARRDGGVVDDADFTRWVQQQQENNLSKPPREFDEGDRSLVRPRICVIGANRAGKSTLVGVLAAGVLDNGQGLSRGAVLRHGHEALQGTTSSITEAVADSCVLMDLAGHEKYLKTTIFGLTARSPDAALLVVDARDTQQNKLRRMTLEHLGVALALKLKVIVALTHADALLESEEDEAVSVVRRILKGKADEDAAVVVVSSVTGMGYDRLRDALSATTTRRRRSLFGVLGTVVRVHAARRVPSAGTVLFGTVHDGVVCAGDHLVIGPVNGSEWRRVRVRSIRLSPDEVPVFQVGTGQSATFSVGDDCDNFVEHTPKGLYFESGLGRRRRPRGTILLSPDLNPPPLPTLEFRAEILVLCPPKKKRAFYVNYQTVVHAHSVRQAATITSLSAISQSNDAGNSQDEQHLATTGKKAACTLRFLYHPELMTNGTIIILRDGRTRAVGTVVVD